MNEQVEYIPEDESQGRPHEQVTGNRTVDEVVASLAGLEGRPVEEHVAVFEAAHERLRAALAGAAAPTERPNDRSSGAPSGMNRR